jgi:cysteine desulfurase
MKISSIYMDYHATTPVDPRVREAMAPFFDEAFGNPSSSTHAFGWQAEMAVEKARGQVAATLGAEPGHIVFTSGATESNNLGILGTLEACPGPRHLIVCAVEHKAVLEVADEAQRRGTEVTVLPVNRYGQVTVESIAAALRPHTKLVSIMTANNEIGTVNPIGEIGRVTRAKGIWLHTDAAQAIGRIPISVNEMGIDLLSLSGHKIYGPKGVGAMFVRRDKVTIKPLLFGGNQEWGLRPGTLNVPGIVGLGEACAIAAQEMNQEASRLTQWRNHLVQKVLAEVKGAQLNGHPEDRLPGNISLSFAGLKSDLFTLGLGGLACSSGAACGSTSGHPSHVLKAIGVSSDLARATLRLGLGRFTTATDVDKTLDLILEMARKNQDLSLI